MLPSKPSLNMTMKVQDERTRSATWRQRHGTAAWRRDRNIAAQRLAGPVLHAALQSHDKHLEIHNVAELSRMQAGRLACHTLRKGAFEPLARNAETWSLTLECP